jgi:hypothetical protein
LRLRVHELDVERSLFRALTLCTCCRHYPGTATGGPASLIPPVVSAFPDRVFGSACASSFSRLAQRSLALRPAHSRCHPFVARLTGGFSHFVASMTAPVASGGSDRRVGLSPTGKRRLCTAHTLTGSSSSRIKRSERWGRLLCLLAGPEPASVAKGLWIAYLLQLALVAWRRTATSFRSHRGRVSWA